MFRIMREVKYALPKKDLGRASGGKDNFCAIISS